MKVHIGSGVKRSLRYILPHLLRRTKSLIVPNSYTNMNITRTQGLSEGQKYTLKALGAVEN
ncbi:MAG: hypothetical protein ACKPFF_03195 [Planktothrix sp.]